MPWSAIAVLTPTLVGAGWLIAWIGRRAATGRLDRNWIAGIRTSATLASDEAWEAAHRVAGTMLVWAGAASAVSGLALLSRPSDAVGAAIVLAGQAVVVALVAIACVRGNRAAKAATT